MTHPTDLPIPDLPDEPPTSTPQATTRPAGVTVTDYTAVTLRELLSICEEFLRTAGPVVLAELHAYLACQNPPAEPAWLIDMLGFHSLHLRQLTPTTTPSPREVWQ
jgi:hypothetical protein